ncbi:hypothetical protein Scep_014915 [Stephania cephalantha]|uniref:Uncharacterized protein n=1 Tax=Stephania cephalantha TaxID=152367 RepID=A0AAP0P0X6_9MAGN
MDEEEWQAERVVYSFNQAPLAKETRADNETRAANGMFDQEIEVICRLFDSDSTEAADEDMVEPQTANAEGTKTIDDINSIQTPIEFDEANTLDITQLAVDIAFMNSRGIMTLAKFMEQRHVDEDGYGTSVLKLHYGGFGLRGIGGCLKWVTGQRYEILLKGQWPPICWVIGTSSMSHSMISMGNGQDYCEKAIVVQVLIWDS